MFCSFQYSQNCKSKSLLLVFEFILHLSLTHNCLLTSISAIIIHENLETTTPNVSKQRIYLYCLKILRHVYWDIYIAMNNKYRCRSNQHLSIMFFLEQHLLRIIYKSKIYIWRLANSPTCYNWIIVYELNYVNLNIEQSDGV